MCSSPPEDCLTAVGEPLEGPEIRFLAVCVCVIRYTVGCGTELQVVASRHIPSRKRGGVHTSQGAYSSIASQPRVVKKETRMDMMV